MKAIEQNSNRLDILANDGSSPSRDVLADWLTSWRQKLGYFSVFAALPTIMASQSTEAPAQEAEQPTPNVARRGAKFADGLKIGGSSDFLKGQSQYRLPHQKGSLDILSLLGGNDDCPGRTISAGTYTAALPYIDSGNTAGANNTVNAIYCYYCNSPTPGPDHIYTFRVTATGPNPQIQVTTTSAGYDPAIYLLYENGSYGRCPSGTNNFAGNHMDWLYNPTSGSTETIQFNLDPYWLGAPLHLFVDSAGGGTDNAGDYTIRMQDVTISPVVSSKPRFDFDGDGRADISVFRPSNGTWYLNRSSQGFSAAQYGLSTDKVTPLNFNGDRTTDLAVFRDGTWWQRGNYIYNYYDQPNIQFGLPTDIPVPADYNGDGYDELAVYRNGTWWMWNLYYNNNDVRVVQFGLAGDKPVPADYDGDGRVDQAVYRNGEWHLNRSSLGYAVVQFGLATDNPVVGDYDGDGKTDLAVFRDGVWYLLQTTNGLAIFQFGLSGDVPVPDDYDGDGKTDAAVYRNGAWWILQSTGGFAVQQFGQAGDKPIQAAYLP